MFLLAVDIEERTANGVHINADDARMLLLSFALGERHREVGFSMGG